MHPWTPFVILAASIGSICFLHAWKETEGDKKESVARLLVIHMSPIEVSPPNMALGAVEKGHQASDETQTAVGVALSGRAEWESLVMWHFIRQRQMLGLVPGGVLGSRNDRLATPFPGVRGTSSQVPWGGPRPGSEK